MTQQLPHCLILSRDWGRGGKGAEFMGDTRPALMPALLSLTKKMATCPVNTGLENEYTNMPGRTFSERKIVLRK